MIHLITHYSTKGRLRAWGEIVGRIWGKSEVT